MKHFIFLSFLFLLSSPSQAITWNEFWEPFTSDRYHHHHHRRYYYRPRIRDEVCTKEIYKETYIPGDMYSPGYVRKYRKKIEVPCN